MAVVLAPFIVLSVVGLVLSIVAHCCGLLGLPQPLGGATWALHIGIFIVWIPVVLISLRLTQDFKRRDFWKAALRGCPNWMRWMTYASFIYAVINFVTFAMAAPNGHQVPNAPAPAIVFRGFSGHWMAFYSAALEILYSAVIVSQRDPGRRCPNGHPASPSAEFCERCGTKIVGSNLDACVSGTHGNP
jgi:hypothetical protein